MKQHVQAFFGSYAEILFLQGTAAGAAIFAVLLLAPKTAGCGVLSVLSAYAFAQFIGLGPEFLRTGYYTYNPLLVGLSIGHLFEPTPLVGFLVVSAGVLTLVLTVSLANLFSTYLRLPILSLPFVVASSIAYLASLRYSGLLFGTHGGNAWAPDVAVPAWMAGFFKSFGAILFAPTVPVGLALALLVGWRSRILLMLALAGYGTGATLRGLMLGSAAQAYADPTSFNFILIAMAVGGVFLIPSPRSFAVALGAVAVSTLFLDATTVFWSYYGIPVFTLPFNAISLATIYVLGLSASPLVARYIKETPEETLDHHLSTLLRFSGSLRTLTLPFAGKWTVWQGFAGRWTHKGSWSHAYDFVVTDDTGATFRNEGLELEDYFAYRKPVLSPVRGRVVRVIDDLPDNPLGTVDRAQSWGNAVVIRDERGFAVELSHLAPKSVIVRVGDWVERGALLGLCGNSGHSPQPHIHVQVQATDDVGAATLPFSFVFYRQQSTYHADDLPAEGAAVEPLLPDRTLDAVTGLAIDSRHRFEVTKHGAPQGTVDLEVRMAIDGTSYFESDRGRLYFSRSEGTFYFLGMDGSDERLALMFLALPRMPLAYAEGLGWSDHVPLAVAATGWPVAAARFLSAFHAPAARVEVELAFAGRNVVASRARSKLLGLDREARVELDRRCGFARVEGNGLVMRRISNETH
ncbi:MAG: urea transporter [Candidatus Wallbacteria bacterium]|nr:urea transporter [Candidatus Wallbacteria bacterium]